MAFWHKEPLIKTRILVNSLDQDWFLFHCGVINVWKRSSIWANEPRVIHLWAIISVQSRDLTEQLFVLIKIYTQLKVSNQLPLKSKAAFSTNISGCWLSLQRQCFFVYENFPRSLSFPWGNLLVQTEGSWDNTLPERFLRKEICKKTEVCSYF